MKFIHTSDWHLGRSLHGQSLLEDQSHVLDQLIDLIKKEKPDLIGFSMTKTVGFVYMKFMGSNENMRNLLSRIARNGYHWKSRPRHSVFDVTMVPE